MILAVDCGNSRLKWGLHGGSGWLRTGTVPLSGIEKLKSAWAGVAPSARRAMTLSDRAFRDRPCASLGSKLSGVQTSTSPLGGKSKLESITPTTV